MAIPVFSDFKRWVGKNLTNQQWDFNLRKIIAYLTDGTANLTVGSVAAPSMTISGNLTAATFTGDGSGLTGVSGSSSGGGYKFYGKYLYNNQNILAQDIANSAGAISSIGAYITCDSGIQLDGTISSGAWTTAQADSSGLLISTENYIEGRTSLGWSKNGTSGQVGGIKRVNIPSTNMTNKKLRVWVYIPTISSGAISSCRILVGSGGGVVNYKYWDKTTDVNGSAITTGKWQLFEADTSITADGSGGSYDNTALTSIEVDLVVSSSNATFSNALLNHVVALPDTSSLDVDITINGVTLISGAETNSFYNLTAGVVTTRSSSLSITTINTNDIIRVNINNAGSFGGQDITVYIK